MIIVIGGSWIYAEDGMKALGFRHCTFHRLYGG
jgi:hypothetical protein